MEGRRRRGLATRLLRSVAIGSIALAGIGNAQTPAPTDTGAKIALLARDVDRAEAVKAVKRLQYSYAQYSQVGMWKEMAALFSDRSEAIFGDQTVKGRAAIAAYFLKSFGNGREGLAPGGLHTQLISEPMVTLSPDGMTAKGRWHDFSMIGQHGVGASWAGAIYENEYVKENGVWKIARFHSYPQFAGPYETGWRNVDGDLETVPYHYTPDSVGIPVPAAVGPALPPVAADRVNAVLTSIETRVGALVEEDKVRNLQHIYGYYVDLKMWDDVADLFTADGVYEIGGLGIWDGPAAIRKALEVDGPAGLKYGQLNNHVQFDVTVTILPGGTEARARGIDLGMLGDVKDGQRAQWSVAAFENRYVKQGGMWRIREMRIFPMMKSDYYQGWGKSRIVDTVPTGASAPSRKASDKGSMGGAVLAFSDPNPVTKIKVAYPKGTTTVGTAALLKPTVTDYPAASAASLDDRIAEANRKLAVAKAYDGVENVSGAFANYIDDFQWDKLGLVIAQKGHREMPFAGFYRGPEHVTKAETTMWGPPRDGSIPRTNIPIHLRIQPVIDVSPDGRSANLRTRLFSIGSSLTRASSLSGAMYPNDQAVLENGVWKMWSIGIDEFYYQSTSYEDGWSRPRPPQTGPRARSKLLDAYPPDILNSALGVREAGYPGGTGEIVEWPEIKEAWFSYVNPVSGRKPPHYWPDCETCVAFPETSLKNNGY